MTLFGFGEVRGKFNKLIIDELQDISYHVVSFLEACQLLLPLTEERGDVFGPLQIK